jgi:hypothetical protein
VFPASTENPQNEQHLSEGTAALNDTVIDVPILRVALATNRQTDTALPWLATLVLVYSPSFVHVPVPPTTLTWSEVVPPLILIVMPRADTTRIPWSPAASVLVAVVKAKELETTEFAPVPNVPSEVIMD